MTKIGTTRIVTRFLFFPVTIDGKKKHFVFAEILQRYVGDLQTGKKYWENLAWIK